MLQATAPAFLRPFALALVVGVVRNRKSSARPNSDIVRLDRVRPEIRQTIEIVAGLVSQGKEEKSLWNEVLVYADGGLELLWQEIQALGAFDLVRLLREAKEKWPRRLAELIPQLELPQDQAT
jgi:hypothetical protein